MRIGQGYDLHKLVEGRKLIIGGVEIPHTKGLLGHSDADVLIHALIDSILGALALGDIGSHFPDNDIRYKDIDSMALLYKVYSLIKGRKIHNIDSTIIIQQPKMRPYIDQMRTNIARALNLETSQVSIKAKTNEGVDAVGQEEAVEAFCVVLVE